MQKAAGRYRRSLHPARGPPPAKPAHSTGDVAFTDEEIAYLRSQPLTRFTTVAADGQPDVVPVAFEVEVEVEVDGTVIWVGGNGPSVTGTRRFRNVRAGNRKVALVVDDPTVLRPVHRPGVRIYGEAGDEPHRPLITAPSRPR